MRRFGEVEEVRLKGGQQQHQQITEGGTRCAIGFLVFRSSKGLKSVMTGQGSPYLMPPSSNVLDKQHRSAKDGIDVQVCHPSHILSFLRHDKLNLHLHHAPQNTVPSQALPCQSSSGQGLTSGSRCFHGDLRSR